MLRSALTQSHRHAAVTALGVSVGALAWGAAAAVGAATLLAASKLVYRALTIVGSGYMAYLGVILIVRSFRHEPVTLDQAAPLMPLWRSFLTGAWTRTCSTQKSARSTSPRSRSSPPRALHTSGWGCSWQECTTSSVCSAPSEPTAVPPVPRHQP
ncbi:LysE family transporter [Curtobacterium sp. MCSS17_008]|uniref:LysE family transporter n=1 Tax=Curtobacterium sp. MCSS17_008 TaxID=2175647 RepID=UPI0015E8D504